MHIIILTYPILFAITTNSTVFFTLWPSWLVKNEHYDLTFALTSGKEADKKKGSFKKKLFE